MDFDEIRSKRGIIQYTDVPRGVKRLRFIFTIQLLYTLAGNITLCALVNKSWNRYAPHMYYIIHQLMLIPLQV